MKRRKTRQISLGGVKIGGNAPVVVQTMTTTNPRDIRGTVEQILRIEKAGAEIVRVAVPDMKAAGALKEIKKNHYDCLFPMEEETLLFIGKISFRDIPIYLPPQS
jgi:4-hydroxy-3-methylbut-2-en-1-yl diphosphate synthase IspG/GcpE